MISCIIVDDQPHSCSVIEGHIKCRKDLILTEVFNNPVDALNFLEETNVDLVFIDIQMPQLNGLDFIEIARNKKGNLTTKFIITTGFNQYAIPGFEQGASDYLLKPVGFKRFNMAIDRLHQLHGNFHATKVNNFFFADYNGKKMKILFADIIYLEANNNYVNVYTNGLKVLQHTTMNAMQEMLGADNFLRVHKSYIVSIDYIESIQGNEITLTCNNKPISIPISRTYREIIYAKLNI